MMLKMENKFYSVIYDNGREFEYYFFKNKENALKIYDYIFNNYWFCDLKEWEIHKKWYRIDDTYWGMRLDLREESFDD